MSLFSISGEQLIQNLKTNHLNSQQKIELAAKVHINPESTSLPNVEEFLIEWVVHQLARSIKLKDELILEAPVFNPDYWQLLIALIPTTDVSSSLSEHFLKAVLTRQPFVPVITHLVNFIYNRLVTGGQFDEEKFIKLLNLVRVSMERSAPYFDSVNQEWLIKLFTSTLLLVEKLASQKVTKEFFTASLELLNLPASGLVPILRWSNSYKKLFQTLIDQLLLPIFKTRKVLERVRLETKAEIQNTLDTLDEIVQVGLFHPSYVLDYATLITSPNSSYRTVLFTHLETWALNTDTDLLVLDTLPLLFGFFVKQVQETTATQLAFDLSWEFVKIVLKLPISSSALESISGILELLHEKDIYTPTNDSVTKNQLSHLEEIGSFLQKNFNSKANGVRPSLFRCYRALVTIDYSLVDSCSASLWKLIVYPHADEKEMASSLALALIREYGRARQWKTCFTSFVGSFDSSNQNDIILNSPQFTDGLRNILSELSSKVQALEIFHIVSSSLLTPSEVEPTSHKKKRRLSKTTHLHGCCTLLTHLIRGIPANLLPYSSVQTQIQDILSYLMDTLFSFSDDFNLASEQTKLLAALNSDDFGSGNSPSDCTCVSALNTFANALDQWQPLQFSDSWLACIFSWCSSQRFSSGPLVEAWEVPVSRLALQSLDSATFPREVDQNISDLSFNRLEVPMTILKHARPFLLDSMWLTLLGPWFPLIGELADAQQKQLMSQSLIESFESSTQAEHSISGLGNIVLSSSRFFEISSLRTTFLSTLFGLIVKRLMGQTNDTSAWDSIVSTSLESSTSLSALDSLINDYVIPAYIDEDSIESLEALHRLLLIITYAPATYFTSFNKIQLSSLLYIHQKLLALLMEKTNSTDRSNSQADLSNLRLHLQVGWKINLAIIGNLSSLTQGTLFILQDQNHLSWLLERVVDLIKSDSLVSDQNDHSAPWHEFIIDLVIHILTSSLNHYVSVFSPKKSTSQNGSINLLECLVRFALSKKDDSFYLRFELTSRVIEQVKLNSKNLPKLGEMTKEMQDITIESWDDLSSAIDTCQKPTCTQELSLIKTTLARVFLHLELVQLDPEFSLSPSYQSHLQTILSLICSITTQDLLLAHPFCYKFLIDHALRIQCGLLSTFPSNFLPNRMLLPSLASLFILGDKSVQLNLELKYELSTKDKSTFLLEKSTSALLSRLDPVQWDIMLEVVSGRFFKHLSHPVHSQSCLIIIQLCCVDYSESYKHLFAKKVESVMSLLIRALQLTHDDCSESSRYNCLSLTQSLFLRPDVKISSNLLAELMATLTKLSVGNKPSEILMGGVLTQIIIGYPSELEKLFPILIRALVRLASSPEAVLVETLRNLRFLKKQPRLTMYIQNLLVQLVKQESAPASWFLCFDALYPQSPEVVLQWLDENNQFQFKRAYQDYLAHHKYSGKV